MFSKTVSACPTVCFQTLLANSVDPDQTAPKKQSDLSLCCLHRHFASIFTINMACQLLFFPCNSIIIMSGRFCDLICGR